MPTIAPSYIYSFFALIAVSSILITSFGAYATTLRNVPEIGQLNSLLRYVATMGSELATLVETTNSTSKVILELPSRIGAKRFWMRLANDSRKAWVEGALGIIHEGSPTNQVYLRTAVAVLGNYSSEYGPAVLECFMNGSTITLHLGLWREDP